MQHRTSTTIRGKRFWALLAASSASALALTFFVLAPAQAQETMMQETTDPAAEARTVAKAGDTVARAGNATTGAVAKTGNGVAETQSRQALSITQRRDSTQVAAAQQVDGDGSQDDAREGDSLAGETARITDSADSDDIVDRIEISAANCDVSDGNVIVVEDNDGTRARLVVGTDIEVIEEADRTVIRGTEANGNLGGIDASGQFGTEGETVVGEVVSAPGISCEDDGGDGDGGDGADGDGERRRDGDRFEDLEDASCARVLQLFRGDVDDQQYRDGVDFASDEVLNRVEICLREEIIDDTAADGDLPDTGGPAILGLAVLGLAACAVGASVIRFGRRR